MVARGAENTIQTTPAPQGHRDAGFEEALGTRHQALSTDRPAKGLAMLVLERRKDEEVVIGGGIVVRVTDIRGHKVRLGITAPAGVAIDRREVAEAKAAAERERQRLIEDGGMNLCV